MTFLLEIREKLRILYGKYEIYVTVAVKFILGIAVFFWINSGIGYMERLNQLAVVLLLALACAFCQLARWWQRPAVWYCCIFRLWRWKSAPFGWD